MVTSHFYPFPADTVWAHSTLWPNLARISLDAADYDGLPHCRMRTGQVVEYRVSAGFPWGMVPWTVRLEEVDQDRRRMRTHEHGGPIKDWRHTQTVEPEGYGCRLTDEVHVDAGGLTLIAWFVARSLYGQRHERRMALLSEDVREANPTLAGAV